MTNRDKSLSEKLQEELEPLPTPIDMIDKIVMQAAKELAYLASRKHPFRRWDDTDEDRPVLEHSQE